MTATNKAISALDAGTALAGTEVAPFVQSAATVKITATQIKTWTSASPTLVTPVLGVATATSINKVAITAPATSATLTIADGLTLAVSVHSLTLNCPVFATGASHTVDELITVLQGLGLIKQS